MSKLQSTMRKDEIIETYWNVNLESVFISQVAFCEIIETYWNVNEVSIANKAQTEMEIIETYWNVNRPFSLPENANHMK